MNMGPVFAFILLGFVLGVVAVVAAESLGLLWILKRLRFKAKTDQAKISSKSQLGSAQIDTHQSLNFAFKKEGVVWVLEPDKVSKLLEKQLKEQKRKKEVFEVTPLRKYGKIKGQSLVLTEPDGLDTAIPLKDCVVETVSSSHLPSKKWAKKFPVKVESKTSAIYHGSKTLYIYLESSWEKEAWCKTLRLASCDQKEKLIWFTQLHEEFHNYLTSLNTEYHSFMKPSGGSSVEAIERSSKPDSSSSKVRQFLKKLTRKTSRVGLDNKSAWTSVSYREERKNTENSRDAVLAPGLMKSASSTSYLKSSTLDNAPSFSSTLSRSGSQSLLSVSSDVDTDEKFGIDEGTLCWNLLISRLFFDLKGNAQIKRSMLERIQMTLSNLRTPSYVGEVICTDIDMGNIPPCIIGMRILPMEMSEVWALEVDIEYSGSALIGIETRLEVGELELQKGTESSNPELLEDFEYFNKQLNLAEGMNNLQEPKEDVYGNTDGSKIFKSSRSSSTHGSKWKSILNSVAKQVSQVPLSLGIRVTSLRGTLRLQIKPPPSDQLWYGFTFMPDLDFNLESSIGEHKITNSHIALFLVNRLKAAIRETLVLPNCESICIPWMQAEKDDWVPWTVAPFIWINQESRNEPSTTSTDAGNQPSGGVRFDVPEPEQQDPRSTESSKEPARKSDSLAFPPSGYTSIILRNSQSLEDLTTPLLEENDKPQEARDLKELVKSSQNGNTHEEASEEKIEDVPVCQSPPRSSIEQDESKPKKAGRRERMLDLRKKMSEKFEEKKRHIVEKMKGQ